MRGKAIVSIIGVAVTAIVSFVVLFQLMVDPVLLGSYGLAGVFIASMMSHLTVVARDMFIPIFLPLASVYQPILLGLAAGVGAALGEITTYFLGWGVAESLDSGDSRVEDKLADWIKRFGLWAVLLVAVTPLPDTPIVLLAGSSRLPLGRLFMVEIVGKSVLYCIGAIVGGFVFTGMTDVIGGLASSFLMVVGSIVFCILVTWRKSRDLLFGWVERFFV
jgi:membrane protein YqaA with SNARE-associated domain